MLLENRNDLNSREGSDLPLVLFNSDGFPTRSVTPLGDDPPVHLAEDIHIAVGGVHEFDAATNSLALVYSHLRFLCSVIEKSVKVGRIA